MKKAYYRKPKTFVKFDDKHYLLYLNEEIVENYLPENAEADTEAYKAYCYTGNEEDGSTKIESTNDTYADLVAGLIKTKYTVSEELSLHRQRETKPEEFIAYNDYCEQCKVDVALLLKLI